MEKIMSDIATNPYVCPAEDCQITGSKGGLKRHLMKTHGYSIEAAHEAFGDRPRIRSADNSNLIQFRAAPGPHNIHGPTINEIRSRVGGPDSPVPSSAKATALSLRRYFNLLETALCDADIDDEVIETLADLAQDRSWGPVLAFGGSPEFLPASVARLVATKEPATAPLAGLAEKLEENPALVYAVQDAVERRIYRKYGSDR
jgi:hypothetical protein